MMNELNTSLAATSFTQGRFDNAAKDITSARSLEQIETAAKEFEAMFVSEMMKPMFEGIQVDETFGGGKGEEVYRGMMLQEYGKLIAQTGQIGIADAIKAQMIEMQTITEKGGIDAHNRDILKETNHDTSIL